MANNKTPKRTTNAKAGRKNRGHRSQRMPDPMTEHRCEVCGERRLDPWGKAPRMKYGATDKAAHPYCVREG